MTKQTPRGIRNNNPGNIEYNPKVLWQGLNKARPSDGRFCIFTDAVWGIRAIARVLITYQDKRRAPDGSKIDTTAEFISRWAPSHENDTKAYIESVRAFMELAHRDDLIDVHDYDDMVPLVEAIIRHENGQQPYPKRIIHEGLRLAGVEPPKEPLPKSPEGQGAIGAVGGAVAAISEAVKQIEPTIPLMQQLAEAAPWALVAVLALGFAGWMVWRWKRTG